MIHKSSPGQHLFLFLTLPALVHRQQEGLRPGGNNDFSSLFSEPYFGITSEYKKISKIYYGKLLLESLHMNILPHLFTVSLILSIYATTHVIFPLKYSRISCREVAILPLNTSARISRKEGKSLL